MKATSFRLDADTLKLLVRFAKQDGTSMTDVIRTLLRQRAERRGSEKVIRGDR